MVKNITLSAEERLIDLGREKAATLNRSLNDAFREWLEQWTSQQTQVEQFDRLMDRLETVDAGRTFSRDELNAR